MTSALLGLGWAGWILAAPPPQESADPEGTIVALIEQCGAPDPMTRDRAADALARLGRAAWPALERCRDHPDPEVRARASDLLRYQKLRRQIPYRVLEEHPGAVRSLLGAATADKLAVIRTLGNDYPHFRELLRSFLLDPEPAVLLASAEALHAHRDRSWILPLFELFPTPACTNPDRVAELLSSVASSLPRNQVETRYREADLTGRIRLLELSNTCSLPLVLSESGLRAFLASGDPRAVRAALAYVRDHNFHAALPLVLDLLGDPHSECLEDALFTLRTGRMVLGPDHIASFLKHERASVREEALRLCSLSPDRKIVPEFRRLLRDPSPRIRRQALHALWNLLREEALPDAEEVFLRDNGEAHEFALDMLLGHPAWIRERARKLAAAPDAESRLLGALVLLRLDGPSTLPLWARDPDEWIRQWALEQARSAESTLYEELLRTLAADPSESLRFEALKELARKGDLEALRCVERYVDSAEYSVQVTAVQIVLAQPSEDRLPLARSLVGQEDAQLCRIGLGALDERRCYDQLERALDLLSSQDRRLRRTAAKYVRNAASRGSAERLRPRLPSLLRDLTEEDAFEAVLALLLSYGDIEDAGILRKIIRDERPGADRALRVLSIWSEENAAETLRSCSTDSPALLRMIFKTAVALADGRDSAFPASAAAILHRSLREGCLFDLLVSCFDHSDPEMRAVACRMAGELSLPRAAGALLPRLDDPEPMVRHAAIDSLSALGDDGCAPLLLPCLDDDDPDVRAAAAEALSRLAPAFRSAVAWALDHEDCPWVARRLHALLEAWPAEARETSAER